jgi:hypothetical protein
LFNLREDKLELANNRLNRKFDDDTNEDDETIDEDLEVEEVDSDEWEEDEENLEEAILPNDCLFCDQHSR